MKLNVSSPTARSAVAALEIYWEPVGEVYDGDTDAIEYVQHS